MTSKDKRLSILSNTSESSIGGLIQELLNKKSTSSPTSELKFGDTEGSDFKRLINKKKYKKISNTDEDTVVIQASLQQRENQQPLPQIQGNYKKYHVNSPDFRPVVRLSNPSKTDNTGSFTGKFFGLFSQRKDRYFNNDRDELSKDIFPAGYQS